MIGRDKIFYRSDRKLACLLLVLPVIMAASSNMSMGSQLMHNSLDADVVYAPTIAVVGLESTLRYEIRLASFARTPVRIHEVEILDASTRQELASLSGYELRAALRAVDEPRRATDALERGRLALLYIDVRLPDGNWPRVLLHRFRLSDGSGNYIIEGARTPIREKPQPDLGAPLVGGPWVAVYEPSMDGGHRRVPYAVAGQATIPGRFAIDWFRVDENGRHISSEGAPVLAVADADVVNVRDDFTDPTPASQPLGPELENDAGNYITLKLKDGRYVFYEHLKQGIQVNPGQKVRKGQVIAFVGSTGHARYPHLHFHVTSVNSPLGADGIPYGFNSLLVLGQYKSIYDYEGGGPWQVQPSRYSGLPKPNAVINFPLASAKVSRVRHGDFR